MHVSVGPAVVGSRRAVITLQSHDCVTYFIIRVLQLIFISCVQLSGFLVLLLLLYITTARRHPTANTAGATLTTAEPEAGSETDLPPARLGVQELLQLLYMMTRGNTA